MTKCIHFHFNSNFKDLLLTYLILILIIAVAAMDCFLNRQQQIPEFGP